ncbi:RNA polymerase sigma factor region1.1 domain-containing protein, partial [Aciditerrimonas ferrireducens]
MSDPDGSVGPPPTLAPPGVAEGAFDRLIEVGRQRGYLSQADLIDVLRDVELSHELIDQVVAAVRAAGVAYVDEVAGELRPAALPGEDAPLGLGDAPPAG